MEDRRSPTMWWLTHQLRYPNVHGLSGHLGESRSGLPSPELGGREAGGPSQMDLPTLSRVARRQLREITVVQALMLRLCMTLVEVTNAEYRTLLCRPRRTSGGAPME